MTSSAYQDPQCTNMSAKSDFQAPHDGQSLSKARVTRARPHVHRKRQATHHIHFHVH